MHTTCRGLTVLFGAESWRSPTGHIKAGVPCNSRETKAENFPPHPGAGKNYKRPQGFMGWTAGIPGCDG